MLMLNSRRLKRQNKRNFIWMAASLMGMSSRYLSSWYRREQLGLHQVRCSVIDCVTVAQNLGKPPHEVAADPLIAAHRKEIPQIAPRVIEVIVRVRVEAVHKGAVRRRREDHLFAAVHHRLVVDLLRQDAAAVLREDDP